MSGARLYPVSDQVMCVQARWIKSSPRKCLLRSSQNCGKGPVVSLPCVEGCKVEQDQLPCWAQHQVWVIWEPFVEIKLGRNVQHNAAGKLLSSCGSLGLGLVWRLFGLALSLFAFIARFL